jgi:hypothetical protein
MPFRKKILDVLRSQKRKSSDSVLVNARWNSALEYLADEAADPGSDFAQARGDGLPLLLETLGALKRKA